VTATTGQSVSGNNFDDWQSPILSGTAFNDANTDGIRQPGETGVPGLPIYVDLNNNGIRDTTTMVFTATALDLPVSIPGLWRVNDVNVTLNIKNQYAPYLEITIDKRRTNASSRLFLLGSGPKLFTPEFANTTFDDEAPAPISGASPFPGSYRPESPLSSFDGLDPNGNWVLGIYDFNALIPPSLNSFSIALTLAEPLTTTDANGNYSFGDLPPGAYALRQEQQDDWAQTAPPSHAIVVNAAEGQPYTGLDFGNFSTHIAGAAGDDAFRLRLDSTGDFADIFKNALTSGEPIFHLPRSGFTRLSFDGAAGNDTLIVDASRGNPLPINGIDYAGGADDGAPGDSLQLIGDGAFGGSYTPSATTTGSGTALLGNLPLRFSGLEPVGASAFSTFRLVTPNSSDAMTIDSLAPGSNRISGVSGGVAFESLTFSGVPSFILDAATNDAAGGGSGNDTVTIVDPGLVAAGLASFRLLTGGGTSNTLTVNGGSFRFDGDAAADNANLTLNVNTDGAGAATLDLNATEHLAALNIGGGGVVTLGGVAGSVLVAKALSIPIGGKLDLYRDAMIIDYTGVTVLDTVQSLIASGYSGGTWTGSGIFSSAAAATTPGTTLGFGEAAQIAFPAPFMGETVDATAILVRFTSLGDANLDQHVDFNDLVALAQHYNAADHAWNHANFNYDANVDFNDLVILAQRYNTTLPPIPAAAITSAPAPAADAWPSIARDRRAAAKPLFSVTPVIKPAVKAKAMPRRSA
jgi:hypothetical protein